MKKLIVSMMIILIMITLIVPLAYAQQTGEGKSFVLDYNQLENQEHPQGITLTRFKEKIEELSGGQIKINAYYSGSLFTQEGEVAALMSGDLDMSTIAFQDIGPYLPAASMFAAPYIFISYEHMERVFATDSEVAADFYKMVSDACGYTPLAAMTQGSRIINTKWEKPIITPEDMKGMILRMPNAPDWIHAGHSLGANVTPIAYSEVYTALQTGVVDAQDNPLPGTYASKFHEVTKQISLTKHIIDVKLLVINNDVWNQMTDQQKQWMREAAHYACAEGSKTTYAQETELLEFFKDYGMIITYPDIDAFQKHSYDYYVKNGLTANWDIDLYNRVQALK
ncbi:MAG: Tripartite ATP-independent periplasmic transporter solute receptor, DctP family [candidate division TA06 bacterium 34_109]|uniref:Tripartite ATP-independent periplasmic transporter solute receptor, DctP family n=1 Tax=candidate division TA06 bacterium 34_109 TaxID=1635277 RepID=A0A101I016_UNCT6|nr:MAG: Tripartite ATP-independent periplasmic transporter solute receptor, DctP family [candidate division TA06 bacterium 34_109]